MTAVQRKHFSPTHNRGRSFFAELFTITPISIKWKLAFISFHSQCQKKQASITFVQGIHEEVSVLWKGRSGLCPLHCRSKSRAHRYFFITSRKFPEAISSAGSPLGLLIPFNTTTHSPCLWMAAVHLFKRTACFALSGFTRHSTATWCALWAAANFQDRCSRARGCVWMEEYLVSLLHARWNLGGLDKCTVTILYSSKLSENKIYIFFMNLFVPCGEEPFWKVF